MKPAKRPTVASHSAMVSYLAEPEFLIEIDVVAALPAR